MTLLRDGHRGIVLGLD